jgi:microcystin-dependent protein
MGQPYTGEIRMFAGNFNPAGWALCQGQIIPISSNSTLFNLIGTTYGGNGQSTFALPDLSSRVPVHMGTLAGGGTYVIGAKAGQENVTLTTQQIPNHTHTLQAAATNPQTAPSGAADLGVASSAQPGVSVYGAAPGNTTLNPASIANNAGNQPHSNIQPVLAVNFIISLFGPYPSPT